MHEKLTEAYKKAAQSVDARLIPVGNAVALAREDAAFDPQRGGIPLTRDGFHLSYNYGRYLAGAVWYKTLTEKSIEKIDFLPADYEYIGKDQQTKVPLYREIEGTRADETLIKRLLRYAERAVV